MSDTTNQAPSTHDVELFDFYVAQLEAYLDGELTADEAVDVRRRLMQEDAYAAALGRLHAQRVQRLEVFKVIEKVETEDDAAARLAASARKLASERTKAWPTWTKVAFGMAACILVGFAGGLIGEYNLGAEPADARSTPYTQQGESSKGLNWVLMQDGEPIMQLPADGKPLQELRYVPDMHNEQPQ